MPGDVCGDAGRIEPESQEPIQNRKQITLILSLTFLVFAAGVTAWSRICKAWWPPEEAMSGEGAARWGESEREEGPGGHT
ncbi:MAG: hypothetical protein ACODAD_08555, partial [Planctomycetota bacterium]